MAKAGNLFLYVRYASATALIKVILTGLRVATLVQESFQYMLGSSIYTTNVFRYLGSCSSAQSHLTCIC